MTSVVAETAAHLRRNFARGHKKLYLPNHVVTFIRPKPDQSPNLATFVVPLQFNKLDLRDYLWHAYNVKVLSVRSYVSQQAPERKVHMQGQIYRPRSKKMMMAELEKPFVWPKPLEGEDVVGFDNYLWNKVQTAHDKQREKNDNKGKGILESRLDTPLSPERMALGKEVNVLRSGHRWKNNVKLDERWTAIGKDEPKRK